MKIINNISDLQLNNTAISIGKFDGIHKGHRLLIDELLKLKDKGLLATIFTFSKAPNEIIKHSHEKVILTKNERYRFYESIGIDVLVEYPTSDELIHMDREAFLKNILIDEMGMKAIVCGKDFKFGFNRLGNIEFIKKMSGTYGYVPVILEKLKDNNSDISSTRIRKLIEDGNILEVNRLLGYSYSIIGQVVHGNEIGRTINFPTANIIPDNDKLLPPNGVYFTKVKIGDITYKGITNIGKKPTVTRSELIGVETNVLDYSGDLYDQILNIEFLHYHRKEMKFDSIEDLKNQITYDEQCCRKFI